MWKVNGARLRALREAKILTQRGLEKAAGVTERTIRTLEQGRGTAQPRTIHKLAKALGVKPEAIVEQP